MVLQEQNMYGARRPGQQCHHLLHPGEPRPARRSGPWSNPRDPRSATAREARRRDTLALRRLERRISRLQERLEGRDMGGWRLEEAMTSALERWMESRSPGWAATPRPSHGARRILGRDWPLPPPNTRDRVTVAEALGLETARQREGEGEAEDGGEEQDSFATELGARLLHRMEDLGERE